MASTIAPSLSADRRETSLDPVCERAPPRRITEVVIPGVLDPENWMQRTAPAPGIECHKLIVGDETHRRRPSTCRLTRSAWILPSCALLVTSFSRATAAMMLGVVLVLIRNYSNVGFSLRKDDTLLAQLDAVGASARHAGSAVGNAKGWRRSDCVWLLFPPCGRRAAIGNWHTDASEPCWNVGFTPALMHARKCRGAGWRPGASVTDGQCTGPLPNASRAARAQLVRSA